MQPRRTVFVFLLAGAAVTGCAAGASESAASFTPEDSAGVRASIDDWVKATHERDTALFRRTIAADIVMYPGNQAATTGADAAVALFTSNPDFSSFVVNVEELTGYADAAYDRGTFTADLKLPDGTVVSDTGSFATKFTKGADGRWVHQWVIWHSNRAPVPAPATPLVRTPR